MIARRPMHLLLVVAFAALGTVVSTAEVAASVLLPVSPVYLDATAAHRGLQVEPATITYTGDGTGLLGGVNVRDRSSGIAWTRWTRREAFGAGVNQLNDCTPDCGRGHFRGYPVKIQMWRPQALHGTLIFTRMTIFYEKGRPQGEPRHYTFTDTYRGSAGGGYGWGPPDEEGYCTHTYGMAPVAGCKDIHSLP